MKVKDLDSYNKAIANVSKYIDMMKILKLKYNAFDGSTALSICFNLSKEKTLEDIIKYREKHK